MDRMNICNTKISLNRPSGVQLASQERGRQEPVLRSRKADSEHENSVRRTSLVPTSS